MTTPDAGGLFMREPDPTKLIEIDRNKLPPGSKGIRASKSLPFANARNGKYTHRVRYVTLYSCIGKPHLAVQCWCGYVVFVSEKSRGTFAAEQSDRPICATCEGRAIGAGKDGAREINGKPVMFSPMVHT